MKNTIITIARQYGSGGREIGEKVAEILGIKTYDKELIRMASADTDIHEKALEKADEKVYIIYIKREVCVQSGFFVRPVVRPKRFLGFFKKTKNNLGKPLDKTTTWW